MEEILDGVVHWKVHHPRIKVEVGCHYLTRSRTAIDPLLPPDGIEWFDSGGVEQVVLSNRHHLRDAERLAERYGCPLRCHEAGLHAFEGGPPVEGFSFGERLAPDLVALEMDAICEEDTALLIEAEGGALLFADSLINYGGVGFVSDRLIGDEPERVKRQIRERCAGLLDQRFESLLFAHGEPILADGREALAAVANG